MKVNTKVLVWQGYGNVSVYEIDQGFTSRLKVTVLSLVEDEYPEEHVNELRNHKTLQGIIEWVHQNAVESRDDSFEKFEVTVVGEL